MTNLVAALRDRIVEAAERERPLRIRGGDTKHFYGEAFEGEPLDIGAYRGILDYEPTELVLQARAGTPLAEIEQALAASGQMLAFEPPHFGEAATLGGTIACGFAGPRRASAGSARDFVLGVRMLDGRGQDLAFGGKVMKNVAGYDVSRLMVGALGTLGVLLDISVKVLPRPERELTLRMRATQEEAIRLMNAWAGKPLPISATCHADETLTVRLSGSHAGVEAASRTLGGDAIGDAEAWWADLREHRSEFFQGGEALWRVSVKSTAPSLALPGRQLLEWHGALRWARTDAPAEVVRDVARKAGGHATLFRADEAGSVRFHPLHPGIMVLHRRLKQTFDPAGILNRGRLHRDL
jgi:glycolate oxidase FAD binding subunit